MLYLNQCAECKSKNIEQIKKARFPKTTAVVFCLSLFTLWVSVSDMINPYCTLGSPLQNECIRSGFLTLGLWVLVVIFGCIRKITYECSDCKLMWQT